MKLPYESPLIEVIEIEIEYSIAAGSVSPFNESNQVMEQWEEEDTQVFDDIEW